MFFAHVDSYARISVNKCSVSSKQIIRAGRGEEEEDEEEKAGKREYLSNNFINYSEAACLERERERRETHPR